MILDSDRESNVEFLMPYDDVMAMWYRCITTAYEPEFLFERFAYQCEHTYPNRIKVPNSPARTSPDKIRKGLTMLGKILLKVGVFSHYRKTFWAMAKPALKKQKIEQVIHIGLVSHHLIQFTQECMKGKESASFYSQKLKGK